MQGSDNFARVREAFCADLAESLHRLGVSVKGHGPKGDWQQIACPLCTDKSGSASVAVATGFLRCHQCGGKADLFAWTGQLLKLSKPIEVCKTLAKIGGVEMVGLERKKGKWKRVPSINEEVAAELRARLFEDDECELQRDFLRKRGFWLPDLLEKLPIGAFGNNIVFFEYDTAGKLMTRARVYNPYPLQNQNRWTWSASEKEDKGTLSFWPYNPADKDLPVDVGILLTEGEWDCLAAELILKVRQRGMIPLCWTGGGSSPIPKDMIPEWMRDRRVDIVYDNDVFQGMVDPVAPDQKRLSEFHVRRKNLIENVADSFVSNRCKVYIRQITIPPLANWGGDLRDMVAEGLEDVRTLPVFDVPTARTVLLKPKQIQFGEVHKHLNQYVEFRCQVAGIGEDVVIRPERHHVKCPLGLKKMCEWCKVSEVAPNGILDWKGREDQLACALTSNSMPRYVMESVCAKPSACKEWTLTPLDVHDGARWSAMAREDDYHPEAKIVEIISLKSPPLSGDVLVRGWLYISANGITPVLMCDHLEIAEKQAVALEPLRQATAGLVPEIQEPADIDRFLDTWHDDVSNNITHVYGRRDVHVALALTMHSVLWYEAAGARRRGWLDCSIIGATRSGKSATVRAYFKSIGLGALITPMGNYSRAGMTIGTVSIQGNMRMKPGAFPRHHGKAMGIDESHLMAADPTGKIEGLFPLLQGARDIGKVEAAKVSGSAALPAAVRLVTIANWLNGGKNSFATPAQHLLALYGTPESLARLDFGVPVDEIEQGINPKGVDHQWTAELQRQTVLRAWLMEERDVVIDPEAIVLAKQLCEEVWKDKYSEKLPLYTEKEKVYSVLRIAIAIANMTLSCPNGDMSKCHVKEVHVKWTQQWLEHTWKLLEYDTFSRVAMTKMGQKQSWTVEALLTARINLDDPYAVNFVLGRLFGTLSKEELRAVVGLQPQDFETWVMQMVRAGGLSVEKSGWSIGFRMTTGATDIIQNLIAFAEQYPEGWKTRYNKVQLWYQNRVGEGPSGLAPIDAPMSIHAAGLFDTA